MSGIAAILRSGPLILMLRFSCPVYSRKLSFEIQKRADGRDRRRSSRRAVEPADCSLSSLNSHPADAEPRSRRRVCRAAAVWGLDLPVRRSELRCRGLATSTPARPTPARPGADHRVAHARAARMGVSGAEPTLDAIRGDRHSPFLTSSRPIGCLTWCRRRLGTRGLPVSAWRHHAPAGG